MRYLAFLLLFLFVQTNVVAEEKKISRKQRRLSMKEEIRKLKNGGILLVRLQSKENMIDALKITGKKKRADKLSAKQVRFNKKVIASFKNDFTFCPVYFFFSSFSDSVLNNQISGIVFVNDSLQQDTAIKTSGQHFLTAEFGAIHKETEKYFDSYYFYQGADGPEKKKAYYSAPDMHFSALKIMNSQFVQLKNPFPYYVRLYDGLPFKRSVSKAVLRMNKKLAKHYRKHFEKV